MFCSFMADLSPLDLLVSAVPCKLIVRSRSASSELILQAHYTCWRNLLLTWLDRFLGVFSYWISYSLVSAAFSIVEVARGMAAEEGSNPREGEISSVIRWHSNTSASPTHHFTARENRT